MTIAEMIAKLKQFARQSDDGAWAEEIVAAAFAAEYGAAVKISTNSAEVDVINQHRRRVQEIRGYVVDKEINAQRLRSEAALFREIADVLESPESLMLRLAREEREADG